MKQIVFILDEAAFLNSGLNTDGMIIYADVNGIQRSVPNLVEDFLIKFKGLFDRILLVIVAFDELEALPQMTKDRLQTAIEDGLEVKILTTRGENYIKSLDFASSTAIYSKTSVGIKSLLNDINNLIVER